MQLGHMRVGPTLLLYFFDPKNNKKMEAVRKEFVKFFTECLGFAQTDIIFISLDEIPKVKSDSDLDDCSKFYSMFSEDTKQKLSSVARLIIQAFIDNPAHRMVTISVTEIENDINAFAFPQMIQNFELAISLTAKAVDKKISEYFGVLKSKIHNQNLTHIFFERTNSFFNTDEDRGVVVCTTNKYNSGRFKYRLDLKTNSSSEQRVSLINPEARVLANFKDNCFQFYAYAYIDSSRMLLLS
jgi:hypothetical protein